MAEQMDKAVTPDRASSLTRDEAVVPKIKVAWRVTNLKELETDELPAASVAPKADPMQTDGPKGEYYPHFKSMKEFLEDKLKYQFEYATLRNALRAKHQREVEAKRERVNYDNLPPEEIARRKFERSKRRYMFHPKNIFHLQRINSGLKESMAIGKCNYKRCKELLKELHHFPVSPQILTEYPDITVTVAKIREVKDEDVFRMADKAYGKFEAMFAVPMSMEVEEAIDVEVEKVEEEIMEAEGGLEALSDIEQYKMNRRQLPGHRKEVPRKRLARGAKAGVSYTQEEEQVVPEVNDQSSDDDYTEEEELNDEDDEDFYA